MKEKNEIRKLMGELVKMVDMNKVSKSHELLLQIIKTDNIYAIEYANYLVSILY
jgi:hypothetical protein